MAMDAGPRARPCNRTTQSAEAAEDVAKNDAIVIQNFISITIVGLTLHL